MHKPWRSMGLFLALFAMGGCGSESEPVEVQVGVMTFNVLCSFCNGDYAPWEERLEAFADILDRHDPDLVGLQELTWAEEVDDFLGLREGFEAVYFIGQEAGPFGLIDYPDAAILYRKARFTLLDHGFFWLSDTPDEPWSTGWADGAQFARIASWARFEDIQTEKALVFVNTHFDNNSPNQEHSAPLFLERIAPFADDGPLIVTGDFNSQPADPAYHTLVEGTDGQGFSLQNAFDFAEIWSVDSTENPPPPYDTGQRIDHIFTAGQGIDWRCPAWTVDLHEYGDPPMYPSDHRAMAARLVYAASK